MVWAASAAAVLVACSTSEPGDVPDSTTYFALEASDPGVHLFPPLADAPRFSGPFQPGIAAELGGDLLVSEDGTNYRAVGHFTFEEAAGREMYFSSVRLRDYLTNRSAHHRVEVTRGGARIAWSELDTEVAWMLMGRLPDLTMSVRVRVEQAATCSDGFQNGDERGTDCGGACVAACAVPNLADVSPATLHVGGGDARLTITGTDFLESARAWLDDASLTIEAQTTTSLVVVVPPDARRQTRAASLVVSNTADRAEGSAPAVVQIENPVPQISNVAPPSIDLTFEPALFVNLRGAGFVPGSVVRVEGVPMDTAYLDETALRFIAPAGQIEPGSRSVTVVNPGPGGGESAPIFLDVARRDPKITAIAPTQVAAGAPATVVTVTGAHLWDGLTLAVGPYERPTTFIDETHVLVEVPPELMATPGSVEISTKFVAYPPTAGTLTVLSPAPVITRVTPSTLPLNGPDVDLTIEGGPFQPTTTITFDGWTFPVTAVVSSTRIVARTHEFFARALGRAGLTVTTPAPGGGVARSFVTVVDPPAPVFYGSAPEAHTNSGTQTLLVQGYYFADRTTFTIDGRTVPATRVGDRGFWLTMPDDLVVVGPHAVVASTPPPGGGTSAPLPFEVYFRYPFMPGPWASETDLTTDASWTNGMTLFGGQIYAAGQGGDYGFQGIIRVPADGSAPPTILTQGHNVSHLAAAGSTLYFREVPQSTFYTLQLRAMPLTGGTTTLVYSGISSGPISNGTSVFYGAGGVHRIDADGSERLIVAGTFDVLAADAAHVLLHDASYGLWIVGTNGTGLRALGATVSRFVEDAALDANAAYWADVDTKTIYRVALSGGAATVLVHHDGFSDRTIGHGITGVVSDGTWVYFSNSAGGGWSNANFAGGVYRVPASGGTPERIIEWINDPNQIELVDGALIVSDLIHQTSRIRRISPR